VASESDCNVTDSDVTDSDVTDSDVTDSDVKDSDKCQDSRTSFLQIVCLKVWGTICENVSGRQLPSHRQFNLIHRRMA
jgi:hypothetical protein